MRISVVVYFLSEGYSFMGVMAHVIFFHHYFQALNFFDALKVTHYFSMKIFCLFD